MIDYKKLSGGRGSASGNGSTWTMGAAPNDGHIPIRHFPAEANVRIKTKTYEEAVKEFANFTKDKTVEYAYEVDADGFVYGFMQGGKNSIYPTAMKNGSIILHNHPLAKDSTTTHFSDADLLSMAVTPSSKGVVATHYRGDHTIAYQVTKGGHFDDTGFVSFVKNLSRNGAKGKTYDDAIDKALKANAKKYGYTYTKTKIKM